MDDDSDDEDYTSTTSTHHKKRRRESRSSRVSQSPRPSSSQDPPLSQSDMSLVQDLLQQIKEAQKRVKRPAEQKPRDKKPKLKEEFKCIVNPCKKVLASKVNLFYHMSCVHKIKDPERLYGCTLDDTIVNLDESSFQHKCVNCEFVTCNINAIDAHNATVHGIVPSASCKLCSFKASSNDELIVHSRSSHGSTPSASTAFKSRRDEMHDCLLKGKFDEHIRTHNVSEVECKICNKNFLFKDFDFHVMSSHPDVYNKKNEVEKDKEKEVVKSGKTQHGFKCRKRNVRFYDKNKAQRHARGHNNGLKSRALVNNKHVTKNDSNPKDIPSETNILFICEACDIACESYDAAVQHSQNHITRPTATIVTETCDTCKFKFESVCYQKHLDRHYRDKELRKETFKTVNYNFKLLLSKDWINSFNADVNIKNIEEQSIYASTRSVKMRVISESATTTENFNLYQCWQCGTFIDPTSVTNHTLNYDSCLKIKRSYPCNVCERPFNTPYVRDKHEKVHKNYESFRIVVFNAKWDKEFNGILNDPNTNDKIRSPTNQLLGSMHGNGEYSRGIADNTIDKDRSQVEAVKNNGDKGEDHIAHSNTAGDLIVLDDFETDGEEPNIGNASLPSESDNPGDKPHSPASEQIEERIDGIVGHNDTVATRKRGRNRIERRDNLSIDRLTPAFTINNTAGLSATELPTETIPGNTERRTRTRTGRKTLPAGFFRRL